ncbi:hypothetical protein M413DRAFT_446180 [Hebeloma cylindrosporum]|uniref:Uncharacterized protein n=1 Tax=Hebeloma cylindrosporum TaxID=76867 RepID=A0A0C3C9B8_HEBCY|nr:hypothetical protein M413DRAFT_446180 [Hebeloma cylindrosporum h7]
MSFTKLSIVATGLSLYLTSVVRAQGPGFVPLVNKRFNYTNLPYKVDTDVGLVRGDQLGYNICNSTTEGAASLCQTLIINSLDDFCLWAPSVPGKTVGEIEGEMIAWCSQPGHGTRIFPPGTITGVQLTKTPDYVQVVGFMDQTKVNMVKGDAGGEMDPHGADLRGNPMGGVVFSTAWGGNYKQVIEWHNFNGGDAFCLKACDPSGPRQAAMCQHIYDTQGCGFNAPSNARNGVFESCAGDSQDPPGTGPGTVPASSLCSTFASSDIFEGTVVVPLPGATGAPTTRSAKTTATPTPTTSSGGSSTSKTASGGAPTQSSGAGRVIIQGAGAFGSAFALMLML